MLFDFIISIFEPTAALAQDSGYQGIDLNAPFGGLSRVSNIGEYIAGLYNYSLGIAGVLAGIMVTIGGVKWLMSAGNAPAIASAKKTIFGAIVGMILLFGSYILLNTVNPRLVKLEVPDVRQVPRTTLNFASETGNLFGKPCYTIKDKARCEASCSGCKCVVMPDPFWADLPRQAAILASISATGGAVVGINEFINLYHEGDGQKGLCIPLANHTVEPGGVCDPRLGNQNCVAGSQCIRLSEYIGACSRGTDGDFCAEDGQCQAGFDCVEGQGGIKQCRARSGGGLGTPCETNNDCARGGGLYCVPTADGTRQCRYGTNRDKDEGGLLCVDVNNRTDAQCRAGSGWHCISTQGDAPIPARLYDLVSDQKKDSCRKGPGQACAGDEECMYSCIDGTCSGAPI